MKPNEPQKSNPPQGANPGNTGTPMTDMPKEVPADITDAKVREIYQRALEAEKRMLVAPEAMVGENSVDEYTELRRVYAPDTFDKFEFKGGQMVCVEKASHHEFFELPDRLPQAAAKGYIPILDHGRFVTGPGGEVLMKIDRRIFEARERAAQRESTARFASGAASEAQASRQNTAGIKDVPAVKSSDIRELENTRKRATLDEIGA